jgi:hypothetical protein
MLNYAHFAEACTTGTFAVHYSGAKLYEHFGESRCRAASACLKFGTRTASFEGSAGTLPFAILYAQNSTRDRRSMLLSRGKKNPKKSGKIQAGAMMRLAVGCHRHGRPVCRAVAPGALEMLVGPNINAPTATVESMEGLSTTDLLETR